MLRKAAASALFLSSCALARHYEVNVGKGGQLKFDPEEIDAQAGDTVTYHFFSRNHAVTESSFREPCKYLDDGLFSGFTPTESQDEPSHTTYTIQVHNATKAIWLYCAQTAGDHCQSGMVHAINAPKDGPATFGAYKELAKKAAKPSTAREDLLPFGGVRAVDIQVAPEGELKFVPNEMNEPVGTKLRFHFNPANHSVVQSSLADPCSPLEDGFSSGFIPLEEGSDKKIVFEAEVKEDFPPTWFYCAQVAPNAASDPGHCQRGMVGSVNAPKEGNATLEQFTKDAADTELPSLIAPQAPLNGVLTVDGVAIPAFDGNVLDVDGPPENDYIKYVPEPGAKDQYMMSQAGGGPIEHYNWGSSLSATALRYMKVIHFMDNILLTAYWKGHDKMTKGEWKGVYPATIVRAIGTMKAQAWIHRGVATDTLQHYDEPVPRPCDYKLPMDSVDEWLATTTKLINLQIGVIASAISHLAHSDSWLIPCLATTMGSKSRNAGVLSMMDSHMACAAPREVGVPDYFAYAYAMEHYVETCPDDIDMEEGVKLEILEYDYINGTTQDGAPGPRRLQGVTVSMGPHIPTDKDLYMGWLGPWGTMMYTEVDEDGYADVPPTLYGYVWAVMTDAKETNVDKMQDYAIAGPEQVWVSQPW